MKKSHNQTGFLVFFVTFLMVVVLFMLTACKTGDKEIANITIQEVSNGKIELDKQQYKVGEEVLLKVIPNDGYVMKKDSLVVNGKVQLGTYDEIKILITEANMNISCEFELAKYKITLGEIKNGNIVVENTLATKGEIVKLQVNPAIGYICNKNDIKITDEKGNLIPLDNDKFVMPASNVKIEAVFSHEQQFNISIDKVVGGQINLSKDVAKEGEIVEVKVIADNGYKFVPNSLVMKIFDGSTTIEKTIENNIFLMPKGDVVISARFNIAEKEQHSISANAVNGQINIKANSASEGEIVTFDVKANTGYQIKKIYITYLESSVEKQVEVLNNQFVMPNADVIINCEFERKTYNIKVDKLQNGTINVVKTAKYQDEVILNIIPNENYRIKANSLKINNVVSHDVRFRMPDSDVVISCEFEIIPSNEFKIECINGNGIIKAPSTAKVNDVVRVEVIANKGYRYVDGSLKMNGKPVVDMQFVMPNEVVKLECEFEQVIYDINFKGTNGKVEFEKPNYTYGERVNFTVKADKGYKLVNGSIKANGKVVTNGFEMPSENVIITCDFELINYNIQIKNTLNGRIVVANKTAHYGDLVKVDLQAEKGSEYVSNSLTLNGTKLNALEFTMPSEDVVLDCKFNKINYTISTSATNGQIIVDSSANYGSKVTISIKPNVGYMIKADSLKVDGKKLNQSEFIMPDKNVVVSCEFEKISYMLNDISNCDYDYNINDTIVQIGDTISITNSFPAGIDMKVLLNGVESNKILTEEIINTLTSNSIDISIVAEDNRVINNQYNLTQYKSGKYSVNWSIKEILSSNAFNKGQEKIAQYCHSNLQIEIKNNKAIVTFFLKEDVMQWLNIEGSEATKGNIINKDGVVYVPYSRELDLAQVTDGVIEIHGYVPKAPIEKFRHVKFTVSLDMNKAILLSK